MNIQQLLDLAREATGIRSDAGLSRRINCADSSNVSVWRRGRALPSETATLKLAALAGIRPEVALMHLNIWRSEGDVRTTYAKALKMLLVQEKPDTTPSKRKVRTAPEQMNI